MQAAVEVYQFRIALLEITPPIWRTIQVPGTYSFRDLHVAIQDSMGWLDSHLQRFRVTRPGTNDVVQIGIPDEDAIEGDEPILPGWDVPVASYFVRPGVAAEYEYDFGDGWEHEVTLEAIRPGQKGLRYPRCLADVEDSHGFQDTPAKDEMRGDRRPAEIPSAIPPGTDAQRRGQCTDQLGVAGNAALSCSGWAHAPPLDRRGRHASSCGGNRGGEVWRHCPGTVGRGFADPGSGGGRPGAGRRSNCRSGRAPLPRREGDRATRERTRR